MKLKKKIFEKLTICITGITLADVIFISVLGIVALVILSAILIAKGG